MYYCEGLLKCIIWEFKKLVLRRSELCVVVFGFFWFGLVWFVFFIDEPAGSEMRRNEGEQKAN